MTSAKRNADIQHALVSAAVARLRAKVMALVFATVCGGGLFAATAWLVVRGGQDVGAHLRLLDNYFPGYAVTWPGAFIGALYGSAFGGIVGWTIAWIYNRVAARADD